MHEGLLYLAPSFYCASFVHDASTSAVVISSCMLMCSATPTKGGETVFPNAKEKVSGPEWSDCAKKGLGVKVVCGTQYHQTVL